MKVGTICKLKVDCLSNKAGTLGVVFYEYRDGFQAIFEYANESRNLEPRWSIGEETTCPLFVVFRKKGK